MAGGFILNMLGKGWTWRQELASSRAIGERLKRDAAGRIVSCGLAASLIAWVGHPVLAIVWSLMVLGNEVLEMRLVNRLSRNDLSARSRVIPYAAHLTLGAVLWAGLGVALWLTGAPAKMLLAIALFIGSLIHASVIYSESRMMTGLSALPVLLALGLVLTFTTQRTEMMFNNKLLVVVSMLTLLAYMAMATVQNITNSERLRGLVTRTERLASEDPLTGLKNRRAFMDAVTGFWREKTPFCVAFIDLDRFKPLNDEHGHAIGDHVLRVVGERLGAAARVNCTARLGGDEFALLVECDGDKTRLAQFITGLHQDVTAVIASDVGDIFVGASFGYALSPDDGETVSEILHAADTAMRRAKATRTGTARYDAVTDAAALPQSAIEAAFAKALRSGGIRAALQPIARVSDKGVVAQELFARWPDSGLARDPTPAEFIPIAEKLGLLNQLLWTTMAQALPVVRAAGVRLAVNITPSQLTSTRFLDHLVDLLASHGLTPAALELEITEQVAIRNLDENVAVLDRARDLGFLIVMDDFGSGYSALSMLDALPLDKLKLDRMFIERAKGNVSRNRVLGATIRLARDLDITCCVEGVEDEATALLVTSMGCHQIQGYWVGQPVLAAIDAEADTDTHAGSGRLMIAS